MNKKIKVIELLNIVASGKDIPKKIKVYFRKDGERMPDYYIFNEYGFYENSKRESFVEDWLNNTMKLNEEVEILEDEEEIDIQSLKEHSELIEWPSINYTTPECLNARFRIIFTLLKDIRDTQNETIRATKQLDKKINKED